MGLGVRIQKKEKSNKLKMMMMMMIVLLLIQYHHYLAAAASTSENTTLVTTRQLSRDHMQQKVALYQFKLSFSINTSSQWCDEGPSWHPQTMNWSMDSDYCKWEGVTCNHTTGDVIGLKLYCSHLVGSIHPNSTLFQLSHLQVITIHETDISGVIPEEIFHLPNLKELRISPASNNVNVSVSLPKLKWGSSTTLQILRLTNINIIGGVLPDSIVYLNSLAYLSLFDCNLSRPIPRYMGNLSHLEVINFQYNDISGVIPEEIFHLPNLKVLRIYPASNNVNVSVNLPKLKWGSSNTLQTLELRGINIIGGILPEDIFHLPNLKELRIILKTKVSVNLPKQKWGSSNTLQTLELSEINIIGGVLPDSIVYLNSLTSLSLFDCNLSGPIPRYMGNLSHLEVINFYYIDISGVIPEEIFHLPNLKELSISPASNNVSVSLPKLKWGSSNTLKRLRLTHINIIGVLPDSIVYLNSLTYLDLSNCNLSGPIPRYMGNLTQLTHLVLGFNPQLSGQIPDTIGYLNSLSSLSLWRTNISGPIPKSIGNLTQLTHLDLSGNPQLSGPIPDTIGYLNSLTFLDLYSCNLSEPIPKSIGNLTQLLNLNLRKNHLRGQMPDSLANLKKLEFIGLGDNNLKGEFPIWVANLTQLQYLHLSDNSLTGSLPSYLPPHFLPQLSSLDLYNNLLSGTIPSWLFQLPSLTYLFIYSNKFTGHLPYQFNSSSSSQLREFFCSKNLLNGTIPKSFSDQLVSLTRLDLSSNKFSGDLDLQTFSHLQHLQRLQLSHNSLSLRITSTTTLPPTLYTLGLASCKITKFPHFIRSLKNLTYLDLSNNQIGGNIPNWIGGLTGMSYLKLSHNSLTGGLEKFTWSSLQYLDLQSNMFNGSLTTSICNMSSLDVLNLSHNNLSGLFPVCPSGLDYRLSVIDLRMNSLMGSLPLALKNFRNLRSLYLHGNRLEGTIPVSFSELDFLEVLDLGSNHMNGTFPHCLETLPRLQVLVLNSNKFYGIINNISQTKHPFPSLRIIDLSENEFSGPLPGKYINNFKGMMNEEVNKVPLSYMGDQYYSDSIDLVIKGVKFKLVKILTVFTTIDLSRNMFEGEIPAYIGKLLSLRYLNLSHNHLVGNIPSSIGDLLVLGSLDLSSNQLVGKIPQHLTHINDLSALNLSHNHLSGPIPEGPQFDTFENESYAGNVGLCGHPLSKKCRTDNFGSQQEDQDEDDDYFFSGFSWEAVVIGYGSGVVLGFVGGYIMFMAGKPKWYVGIIAIELGLKVRRIEIIRRR